MSKMQRNLDGVYFRVEREGRWRNVCYSDMTATERKSVVYDRMSGRSLGEQADYYRRLAELMADTLYDMGEQFGIVGE